VGIEVRLMGKKQKVKYTYTMVRAKKKRTDLRYFVGTELR
jgi:hypothetical protein